MLKEPSWRPKLPLLTTLRLASCGLSTLPPGIGLCSNITELSLSDNPLETLPKELARCTRLTTIFVSGSDKLVAVPAVLGTMPGVTRLGLKNNRLAVVAAECVPPNVQHLILTHNRIRSLDVAVFERLRHCRKLMLANNELEALPGAGVAQLQSLELIRLANNRLTSLPTELLQLPKLAWLAISGNPLTPPPPAAVVPEVHGSTVALDESALLGRGASGVVHAAVFHNSAVAVKRFSHLSSDGRAEDEIQLYAAVRHPGLVNVQAVVKDPSLAVVMELLPPSMVDLAAPPTIVEVIEDRYQPGQSFSPATVCAVLHTVASALAYLHSRCIGHGDVYAHNVLVDGNATPPRVKLVDFGAAFPYGNAAASAGIVAARVERIEVRAWGVLAAELAARVEGSAELRAAIGKLAAACDVPDVLARPTFAEVVAAMAAITARAGVLLV